MKQFTDGYWNRVLMVIEKAYEGHWNRLLMVIETGYWLSRKQDNAFHLKGYG